MDKNFLNHRGSLMEPVELYLIFFDNFPFSILWVDLEGTIITSNFTTEKTFGYKKEDLMSKRITEIIAFPQESLPFIESRFKTLIEEGSLENIETQAYKKDKSLIWVSIRGSIIQLGDKTLMQIIIQDINKRKKEKEIYRDLINNISDVTVECEPDGTMTYISPQAIDFFGLQQEELIGSNVLKYAHPDDLQMFIEIVTNAFKRKEDKSFAIQYRTSRKDGTYIWISARGKVLKRYGRTKLHVVLTDIMEKRKSEEELEKAFEKIQKQNEELKELDYLKDELFADVSHELRTPLVSIRGFTELLLNSPDLNESHHQDLKVILKNEERLERFVNEILEYSRLKSGKIKFKKDTFRVSEILNGIKDELKLKIERKQLVIEENIVFDEEIVFDKHQITKVITNLFSNAVKFSFETGKIIIESINENNMWIFSVRDFGIGISNKDILKLFTRFTKFKDSQKLNLEGVGIGLTVCKKIIDFYGGKIWADSEGLNKGTTFIFQLNLNNNK